MSDHNQFCTFHLDEQYFGIAVAHVQEIIQAQAITAVALAPAMIAGLINLRGQIVTVIDLRVLLGMPPMGTVDNCMNIVVNTEQGLFSLLVDRIGDALELEYQLSEPPPGNVSDFTKSLIQSVYKLDDALLLTVDVEKLVSMEVLGGR